VALLGMALAACKREASAEVVATPAADAAVAVVAVAPSERTAHVFPAIRCGECHESFESQWRDSAHARSRSSPDFLAMARGANADTCRRCHAPVAHRVPASHPASSEGVNCQGCHGLAAVEVSPGGQVSVRWELEDVRMFGPRCGLKDHHFHKMGCSPLHESSTLCAGCHQLVLSTPDGGTPLPVYTEFEEWQASPSAAQGVPCQGCHMPVSRAELAVGEGVRSNVPQHTFMPEDLRARAASLKAEMEGACGAARLNVRVTNEGAGHAIPTGHPSRQLVLTLEVRGKDGTLARREERTFGRRLVNAEGQEVPWFEAVRVAEDTRLQAEAHRSELFAMDGPCSGEVRLALAERPLSLELARRLGLAEPSLVELTRLQLKFALPRAEARP
jgi:hypothetical protein